MNHDLVRGLKAQRQKVPVEHGDIAETRPDTDCARLEGTEPGAGSAIARDLIVLIGDHARSKAIVEMLRDTPLNMEGVARPVGSRIVKTLARETDSARKFYLVRGLDLGRAPGQIGPRSIEPDYGTNVNRRSTDDSIIFA